MIGPRHDPRRHSAEAIPFLLSFGPMHLLVSVPMAIDSWKARPAWSLESERVKLGAAAAAALPVGGQTPSRPALPTRREDSPLSSNNTSGNPPAPSARALPPYRRG